MSFTFLMKYSIYILFTIISIVVIQSCKKDPVIQTIPANTEQLSPYHTIFNSSNSPLPELNADDLTTLIIDRANNIWIGNQSSTPVLKYNLFNDEWTKFGEDQFELDVWEVRDLDCDADNNIWAATVDGVYMYDGTSWELSLKDTSIFPYSRSSVIHVDKSNHVWCNLNGDLYQYADDTWLAMTAFDSLPLIGSLPLMSIYAIESDNDGNLWIGCLNGLVKSIVR